MADDSEFITRLISFGFSEKEAQLYLHLLKHGPKPSSMLAKSLKTYREDVYRTLTSLIDKGMVNPSLETPTVYAAVDLDFALETALKKHESELREMEIRKQELQEMARQQRFMPSDDFSTFKIVKSLREHVAVILSLINSTEREIIGVVPEITSVVGSLYGWYEETKKFIDRGGKVRLISDLSYPTIELAQQAMDIGIDGRVYDGYTGVMFTVFDRKTSQITINMDMITINMDMDSVSLNQPLSILMTDDPAYAHYLISTFELLWEQAVPAEQRIEELLKEGPPHV
jgi:sugar-specific transcriptional regulator TrmB